MNFNDQRPKREKDRGMGKKKTIQMQENTKTINDKTRQQEGRQNQQDLKRNPTTQ